MFPVRFWRRARKPSRIPSRPQCRPALEALESRLAPAAFAVTNASDSGPGSLRQAILDANATPGADYVRFAVPGAGVHTISMLSALPAVTDPLAVDGTSQPGWAGAPLIELSGAAAGAGACGLWLAAPNSSALGLAVNRFAGYGIVLQSYSDVVQACFVGTNPAGSAAGNGYDGVAVLGPGTGCVVAGNVASGNGRFGVALWGAANVVVQANLVGTNSAGTASLPNAAGGIALLAGSGASVIAGNVASGNGGPGLLLSDPGTLSNGLYGNKVGTDASGSAALPNAGPGVLLAGGASYNAVGAPTAAQRNVVSGNAGGGVVLSGPGTSANVVAGDYVGLNAAGTAALANGGDGVLLAGGASGNGVYSNVSSGNRGAGLALGGAGTTGNVAAGDLLGTDASGASAVPNRVGLRVDGGASGNRLGSGNVLSGNALFGALLSGAGTSGNVLSGDLVGTKAGGSGALGNGSHGVFVTAGASRNTLASSVVANSGGAGVLVGSDPALGAAYGTPAGVGNAVVGDSIFANAKLAIDLGPDDGVTANDSQGHSGPNAWQDFPVLTSAAASGGGTRVQGSLRGAASSAYRLDFYASPAADPSGHGQAQYSLGVLSVTTDTTGAAAFDAVLPGAVSAGWAVSATATDAAGDTSELGADVAVPQGPPSANAGAKQSGKEGSAVAFSGSASGGQGALSYSWSFGDGGTASGTLAPSHVYDDNGTYTVTLTVTDSLGQTGTSTTTATIANVAPTPSPGGPYSGTAGIAVAFSGSATDPSSADTKAGLSWLWSFGDGTTSTAQSPSHAYAQAGTYAVTLTATDKDGGSASASTSATIQSGSQPFPNNGNPPPLPPPSGTVINVSTVSQLQSAVANLKSGQTIMVAPGTYKLTGTLYVPQNLTNIAIRGASGKAADVVIQGDAVLDPTPPYSGSAIWGPGSGISGTMPFGIWLGDVQGVTVGDLTLKNFVDDAIILNAGVQSPLIHDVVMLDTGEQLLKSNPDGSGGGVNNGVVEYCTIGYTVAAPNNYTNGIDLHTTQNWVIRDNLFQNIYTTNTITTTGPGALAGPAILIWNGSKNATVVANTFINNQREVAFGLSPPSTITDDNTGGIIADNMIYRSGGQHGDVSIGVWNSPNTEVAYNTVLLNGDYANAVEYRFATTTGVKVLYNLTDAAVTARDGATGTVTGNVTSGAQSSWFANEAIGDLHLTTKASGALGKGTFLAEVSTDYDGQSRPSSGTTDVGADQH